MYSMYNTGSNVTLLNRKLAKQLGLNVKEYASFFWLASGAHAQLVGLFLRTRLQLYNSLAVMVEGIRVIDRAVYYMSIILGLDIYIEKEVFLINVT